MKQIKPGMLCLMINAVLPENRGRVVLVDSFAGVERSPAGVIENLWNISCPHGEQIKACNMHTGTEVYLPFAQCAASWLMPLGDDESMEEVRKEQELELVEV